MAAASPPANGADDRGPALLDRLSPLRAGLGIGGVLLAALFITETLLGRWQYVLVQGEFDALARVSGGVLRDLRIAVVHCLVAAYLPAALLHARQSARRTVLRLQRTLDCTPEECQALADSMTPGAAGMLFVGLLGFALSLLPPYLVQPVPPAPWTPSSWHPEVYWHRLLGPPIGVTIAWLGYTVVTVSLRLSRVASRLKRIDLLDLSPLAPFTRQGLTHALLLIGLLSIWSLVMIETGFGGMMIFNLSATLALIALSLLAPLRGVHARIRDSKAGELTWLNAAIARQRESLKSGDRRADRGDLADLVAYRGLVEATPEWPFSASTYLRVALYTLIPAASWGLGVVGEEIVGRLLF